MASLQGELPNELLIEIGFFATEWSVIEQEIMLHTSAMAAEDTDGLALDDLRVPFNRLRERWFRLANEKLGAQHHKTIKGLNDRLATGSKARNYALHGIWSVTGPLQYEAVWWEQKGKLVRHHMLTNYAELREQTDKLRDLRYDLVTFSLGLSEKNHSPSPTKCSP